MKLGNARLSQSLMDARVLGRIPETMTEIRDALNARRDIRAALRARRSREPAALAEYLSQLSAWGRVERPEAIAAIRAGLHLNQPVK